MSKVTGTFLTAANEKENDRPQGWLNALSYRPLLNKTPAARVRGLITLAQAARLNKSPFRRLLNGLDIRK